MNDKMRGEFEVWASQFFKLDVEPWGEYKDSETHWAWISWQASRAALVVELPAQWSNQCYDDEIMFSGQVIDAIESAGISYK